ncbi:serine/threonine-protein kinase PRP4 homolog isoform X2 [Macrosteles quadrilineatus]|uniref:serine/threonine-protein kinase PRP4 homolog isoform X2 n=1 Tax=Macrosteles quadrilineatus TaxID=74068 RepID=UPI0023E1FECE|nr:serine/threonine-protein kinase PRP4 homolog isoform X2 [Macrosteles quadrilineatus]
MASVTNKNDVHKNEEDDDDLEALRIAALKTLRKKSAVQPTSSFSVTFKPHIGNPNLIAIIPEGADPGTHMRQKSYIRPHPHQNQGRGANYQHYRGPVSSSHSTLKVLSKVDNTPSVQEKTEKTVNEVKEEVSTKFSRFEDTESESEDESEKEEKILEESSDESEDVLALEDEDDSLEALMAQMEHEIESGIDLEHSKNEKKKSKNNKQKGKELKCKSEEKNLLSLEKQKTQTKTAVIEPTLKETDCILKKESTKPMTKRNKSPAKIDNPIGNTELITLPSLQKVDGYNFTIPLQSSSTNISLTPPPKSLQRETERTTRKSRSPNDVLCSRTNISPGRLRSPQRFSPDRRSPLNTSPDHYYSGKTSTSPYYKSRKRGYSNRSRSPVRRKSLSPKRAARDPSPKYYQRRSRSPWSPEYRHSPEDSKYKSPIRRRSLSPRFRSSKLGHSSHSPYYRKSPRRRTPSVSPRRSVSPMRKREYSPHRRRPSPKRDYNQRRNSPPLSPKRKQSPPPRKYSPNRSPRRVHRSPSPKRNHSPRRRVSPLPVKETRIKSEKRSRSPSFSLSPSSTRESKGIIQRNKSPLRPRREVVDVNDRSWRARRQQSPDKSVSGETKEKKKITSKTWENRPWERRVEEGRRERGDKTDRCTKKEKDIVRSDKDKPEELKEGNLKVTDNPLFEARRKKFESTTLVEPASKKIRLFSKKSSPVNEDKSLEGKQESPNLNKRVNEHSVQTEDDLLSGQEEVDDIDNFLNEDQDVLDLSAEVWDSDEDLLPRASKVVSNNKNAGKKVKSSKKQLSVNIKSSPKEKPEGHSAPVVEPQRSTSPSVEQRQDRSADWDESDLRAQLSRRREERLTKAGLLHEKVPRRLLQDAFESALGKKKIKKESKVKKSKKEAKKKISSPVHKEKSDGRRVLVLKRPAPVKMQSAHINVTFPSRDADSESESSYSRSSSSEEERYSAKRSKLPVYMRLGTAGGRKVKLSSRRSQV